jgi:hypothetical protein
VKIHGNKLLTAVKYLNPKQETTSLLVRRGVYGVGFTVLPFATSVTFTSTLLSERTELFPESVFPTFPESSTDTVLFFTSTSMVLPLLSFPLFLTSMSLPDWRCCVSVVQELLVKRREVEVQSSKTECTYDCVISDYWAIINVSISIATYKLLV